jgi:hypothetical protein
MNNLKKLKMTATLSKIGKPGMIWCSRPKPIQEVEEAVYNRAAATEY